MVNFKEQNYVKFKGENGIKTSAEVHYIFADGTHNVVKVDVPMGEYLSVQFREEANANRRERYWVKVSLDECTDGDGEDCNDGSGSGGSKMYQGAWFADKSPTPQDRCSLSDEEEGVTRFLGTLSEVERRRISMKMDNPDFSLRDIARAEGVNLSAIQKSFNSVKKKAQKFFKM
jgi:hypothetical protein